MVLGKPTIQSASPPWSPITDIPLLGQIAFQPKFGMSVVFTIGSSDTTIVQVFLPQRYSDVVTDVDIQSINSGAVELNLVYKGVCESSKAYLLAVEP